MSSSNRPEKRTMVKMGEGELNQSDTNTASSASQKDTARIKRNKTVEKSSFEEELDRLKETEEQEYNQGKGEYGARWKRPMLEKELDTQKENLVFQQIEIDLYTIKPMRPVRREPQVPVLRLYGVTMGQHSVTCHVHGFLPYFYIPAPPNFRESDREAFVQSLTQRIQGEQQAARDGVVSVDIVQKQNIYGFQGNKPIPFLKITVCVPTHVPIAKRVLERGFSFGQQPQRVYATYESNVQFVLRFMIDTDITGMNWIELPAGKYHKRRSNPQSTSQIEVEVNYQDLISHAPEGEWSKPAPLRILSFDIECAGRKGVFPEAKIDPVIQIANMVSIQGERKPFIRNIFTLGTCANIVGSNVHSFDNEKDVLSEWSRFFAEVDPDVIIGYNINNFDLPYLLDRATALGVSSFPYLGRIRNSVTRAKDTTFSSKAYGTRESKSITMEGRLMFDLLQIVQRDYKLRSYTLNAVCAQFLGEQKEDVHHSIITDLQNGNEDTRRRLAVYCLKDAYLPQRLLDKLMSLYNYTEMARVTGVPFNYLLTRGQQIKVVSQLYRKAKEDDLVIPAMSAESSDEQFEGATVIEPTKGYYDLPIATLDFSSLYPSIMMAHNLCYSTYIKNKSLMSQFGLSDDDVTVSPSGDIFVKTCVRKGLLPTILENLLSARKRAKADLKKETDPFKKAVLDGRQLALKISANSVYGFTGATVGKLPCLAISQSTTAFGRQMIEFTRQLVEERYTKANGYEYDAAVIYGDTDSVMIKFGGQDLKKAMELGNEAAEYITAKFVRPIKLEFEKVYFPYLLINKKRYAGLYWTRPEKYDKMDTKGIETVRRDNCRMVQNVIDSCLRKILIDRDVEGAKDFAKQTIADLLRNKIDMSQLVISKQLSKSGEDYAAKQAHVELAERMRKRDAGSAPAMGDRVAYVMIKGVKGAPAYEKAEDPIYVLEHNLPIDTQHYLDNHLAKPLMRIFEPIISTPNELLAGEHTRVIQVASGSATLGGLSKFTVKRLTCLGCKAPLPKEEQGPVCKHCSKKLDTIYQAQVNEVNDLETKFSRLWTQCQRCQGSLHQDVLCASRDCPIFYMRKKVAKQVEDVNKTLKRFEHVNVAFEDDGYGASSSTEAPKTSKHSLAKSNLPDHSAITIW